MLSVISFQAFMGRGGISSHFFRHAAPGPGMCDLAKVHQYGWLVINTLQKSFLEKKSIFTGDCISFFDTWPRMTEGGGTAISGRERKKIISQVAAGWGIQPGR